MKIFVAYLLQIGLLLAPRAAPAQDASKAPAVARPAIERGLAYLATEAPAWRAENKCAACHHTPMMIWATNEAKAAGYPVNEAVLAELTSWALADDEIQHVFPGRGAPPPEADGVNLEPAFLILAVEKSGEKKLPEPLLQRFFADITKRQADDGSFTCYDRRPPIGQFPEAATLMTRVALASPLADRTGWADAASVTEKVDAWIAARPALDANQYRTLRLLLAARLGRPASELQPVIDELLAQQEADGGWIQLKGLTTDAYATGQTLYALLTAGLPRDHPAVEKAVGFLVAAQNEDGSFKVTSYVHGIGQPGAHNPRPITCSASGWAVMALSLARPAK